MEHGPWFYLLSWFLAFTLASISTLSLLRMHFFQQVVYRNEAGRESSAPRAFRMGGLVVAFVFLILLCFDTRLEWTPAFVALLIGTLSILTFSLADDFSHVSWPWHLGFQFLLGFLLFVSGMRIDLGAYFEGMSFLDSSILFMLSLVLTWVVLVMNALNWSDGIDGLMPGVATISFATIFCLSLRPEVNQPTIGIIASVLLGLSLSLLLFNWYPARILAGTGGAYFFGFALAALGLYAGMKVATLLLVLAVPVFDALFVIIRRISMGRSPFHPDEGHFHHLLRSRGWGDSQIASVYLVLTASMALLALFMEESGKLLSFLLIGTIIATVLLQLHVSSKKKLVL